MFINHFHTFECMKMVLFVCAGDALCLVGVNEKKWNCRCNRVQSNEMSFSINWKQYRKKKWKFEKENVDFGFLETMKAYRFTSAAFRL